MCFLLLVEILNFLLRQIGRWRNSILRRQQLLKVALKLTDFREAGRLLGVLIWTSVRLFDFFYRLQPGRQAALVDRCRVGFNRFFNSQILTT